MSVDPSRLGSIAPDKFLYLVADHVLERPRQPWMKNDLGKAMAHQIPGDPLLMVAKFLANSPLRKSRRQIQMQSRINSVFASHGRPALRILHEYHRAHR